MSDSSLPRSVRRSQAERSRATQQRILDVTLDCLMDRGLRDTSTVEVARRAGVSRGALLHHYPSKGLLLQEALRHLLRHEVANIKRVAASLAEAELDLDTFLETLWCHFSGRPFMIAIEYIAAARTDSAIRETLAVVGLEFNDSLDAIWDSLPVESGVSRRERRLALNATLCFLRGMGTQSVWRDSPQLFSDMLVFWKQMLARAGIVGARASQAPRAASYRKEGSRR